MPNGPARVLLTPEDAAEALSIGRTRVYERIRTGALGSVTIGSSRSALWPLWTAS